jgi:hypothetical protein
MTTITTIPNRYHHDSDNEDYNQEQEQGSGHQLAFLQK